MKHFYKALLIIFLLPSFSLAQSFYPGYAVSNKGDTLTGFIKNGRWENNPEYIRFKKDAHAQPVKLTKNDIRFFSINIGSPLDFQRYEGPISSDVVDINNLGTFRDTSYRVDTVFLRVLRKGPNVELFSYDDNLKTRYFIVSGPKSIPTELIYRIYYKIDSVGSKSTINELIFKKQLNSLAAKYNKIDDALQSEINKSDYSGSDIISITDKINGFTGKDITVINRLASPPKVKLMIMLAAFVTVAILVFSVMHK